MNNNFRHHLLSLSLLVGIAAPWAVFAQVPISSVDSDLVGDRVTQLERISNAHSQLLTQLQQQPSDNRSDIDSLRGQIQENQYQLNQVIERQKRISLQMNNLDSDSTPAAQTAGSDQSGAAATPTPDTDTTAASGALVQAGGANTDCDATIALVQDKSHQDGAIEAFQNFIKKYPDSTYLPNTNYWLGQLNYNKRKKDDTTFYFAPVVKGFPKSPKAAGVMYEVGVIMQDKGDKGRAKTVYRQVITKYPGTDGAKQAQKRLGTM